MSNVLSQVVSMNNLGDRTFAEPYAGGAGAALTLLYTEMAPEISINDADPAVYALWWSIIYRSRDFLRLLEDTPVTIEEWLRQRAIYRTRKPLSRLHRGFSAFYLNRCNRSGIIADGGPIGGIQQQGRWKLDARFNKSTLRSRLEKIMEYSDRIRISGTDGIDFMSKLDPASTFYFINPPYFHKGETLYLNSLTSDYHANLASRLRSTPAAAWVLTYDDCPEIRSMYGDWASIHPFSLRYSAAERRKGTEIIITPREMKLPAYQSSEAILW